MQLSLQLALHQVNSISIIIYPFFDLFGEQVTAEVTVDSKNISPMNFPVNVLPIHGQMLRL